MHDRLMLSTELQDECVFEPRFRYLCHAILVCVLCKAPVVGTTRFRPGSKDLNKQSWPPQLVTIVGYMICSLKRYKGVKEFMDLASAVSGFRDVELRLLVNEDDHAIKRFFEGWELPGNTKVFNNCADSRVHLSRADVLLNLSVPEEWVETFGLTLIEAMSFGVPCIAPEVGGPPEIIQDGVHGYTADCRIPRRLRLILDSRMT